jgi:Flp pilus assembly protein TadD
VAQLGIQAAEALDHAHQQGVVHRENKPANLLVDVQGNVWVTDFGLAQFQSDTRLTRSGDLVGTLRYMSPEQALAKRVVMDHRTDIYSLGATLYELLTLQPAFTGGDREELLRQIAFEEPAAPRRLNRAIPVELETIVLKALEKNPLERYATARELADDLRRFLDGQLIRARRPTLRQRARKWAGRHRYLVGSAAVVLVLAAAMLAGSIGWVARDRQARQREAESKVLEALDAADPGLRTGNPHDAALIAAVQRAEAQLASGVLGAELERRAERLKQDQQMLAQLEQARLQAAAGNKETGFDYAGADQLYAQAFARYGLDLAALDPRQVAERVRASALGPHLVAALDDWAFCRRKSMPGTEAFLAVVADLADDDPWTRRLREAAGHRDPAALEELAESPALGRAPADLVRLARALRDAGSWAVAERLLWRAQGEQPADFWINFELAKTFHQRKSPELAQAVRFNQAALALRPQSPGVHTNLGIAMHNQGKEADAEAAFRKAIQLNSDYALAHYNLGVVLVAQGKQLEAEAAYRTAIQLKPDYPEAHNNLGSVLVDQGKLPEAEAACRKAIQLKPDLVQAHSNLGIALAGQAKLAEAEAALRKAIQLKLDYPEAYYDLGIVLCDQKKLVEAEAAYRTAIQLKPDHAEAHSNLGVVLVAQGKLAEAEAACRRAIQLKPDLAQAHSILGNALAEQGKVAEAEVAHRKAVQLKPDHAEAHSNLGMTLLRQGKPAEAEAAFRQAIQLKPDYADAHCSLGNALQDQGKLGEAEAAYRKAIQLEPELAKKLFQKSRRVQ